MQQLLKLAAALALLAGPALANSSINNLPVAPTPLPPGTAIPADCGPGVDCQLLNGASPADLATQLNLNSAGANTLRGNFTNSTGNDTDNAVPSCPDSGGNHLNYTSGTGLSCGTSGVNYVSAAYDGLTGPYTSTSASVSALGLGSTATFTPARSAKAHLSATVSFIINATAVNAGVQLNYGTGTAPTAGATTGLGTLCGKVQAVTLNNTSSRITVPLDCFPTTLTPATAYWIDIMVQSNGTAQISISNVVIIAEERP